MAVAGGTIGAVLAVLLAERLGAWTARALQRRGLPFEFQYMPLFVFLFLALYGLHSMVLFPPTISLLVKFGLLYSIIGVLVLCVLAFLRLLHYQSYIFLVNWLKRK
ncbi:hypothetical protein [Ectobacillus ponti]|uniref:Uncharacterized protein n=1 Tax=Ectobacillus ponti TaxID=2961894 RepID=A0AA41X9X1_9BACI|nr:hypothetical protein [Ectobacillus ponti]MCP8968978.1 hypothetical protein [Ectobacillus ponti]